MSLETVKTVVNRFLTVEQPGVLAITGEWGVGKTFFWNALLKKQRGSLKPRKYTYVSLFGVSSIKELRMLIVTRMRSAELIGEEITAERVNKDWDKLWQGGIGLANKLSRLLPGGSNVSAAIETFAPMLISNALICLDDFERMGPGISTSELLGLISELKEERACKVVLIFNSTKLNDAHSESYKAYREKVIDLELTYAPTAEEAAQVAFDGIKNEEAATSYAKRLDITNIRILKKASQIIDLLEPRIAGLHPDILTQTVMTTLLITWSYYSAGSDAVPLEFIRHWNGLSWSMTGKDKKADEREIGWAGTLEAYEYNGTDELDIAIIKVIERGYAEETGFDQAARRLDKLKRAGDLENMFTEAWHGFHDTLMDNRAELIENLNAAYGKYITQISPMNVDGFVRLMRQLSEPAKADKAIDDYIVARGGELDLFDLKEYAFASDIKDEVLREKFAAHYNANKPVATLEEAIAQISGGKGWSAKHEVALKAANVDDYFNYFRHKRGRDLGRHIRATLSFAKNNDLPTHERAVAALTRLAMQSDLNELRLERHGITVPAGPPPPGI